MLFCDISKHFTAVRKDTQLFIKMRGEIGENLIPIY